MNYEKLYFAFIEKYKNQVFDENEYTEVHHIIPRHAGGDDSKENLIRLTYKQHCFAHHLLWKIYKRTGDYLAWILMTKQEVDKVLANHKAIGKRNVETGFLDSIRHLANTDGQRKHASDFGKWKNQVGLLDEYRKLANDAWRGQKHTDEYKVQKSVQMKALVSEDYEKFVKLSEMGQKVKAENSKDFSEQVIKNAERNEEFLQKHSSRSLNKFISPEGLEFDSPIFAANYYGNVEYYVIENWCKRNQHGWSRKPKATQD